MAETLNDHFSSGLCKDIGSIVMVRNCYLLAVGSGDDDLINSEALLGRGVNGDFVAFL